MRRFTTVSPQVWTSQRFAALPNDTARMLYLYFLTSPHQTSIGCHRAPVAYVCADTGLTAAAYTAALANLSKADLVKASKVTGEVLILRWFKHSPPTNAKHYLGAFKLTQGIEDEEFREETVTELNDAWGQALQRMEPQNRVTAARATNYTLVADLAAESQGPKPGAVSIALMENIRNRVNSQIR